MIPHNRNKHGRVEIPEPASRLTSKIAQQNDDFGGRGSADPQGWGSRIGWLTTSGAVSVVVGQIVACWLNLCGTSPNSLAAISIGFAVGIILIQWIGNQLPESFGQGRSTTPVNILVATLSIFLCWSMPSLLNTTLQAGCETIRIHWPLSAFLTFLFPALVVAVVLAAAGVFFKLVNPRPATPWIQSVMAGTPFVAILLLFALPVFSNASLAAASTVMICAAVATRILVALSKNASPAAVIEIPNRKTPVVATTPVTNLLCTVVFLAAGMIIFAVNAILSRLMPGSLPAIVQAACMTSLALAFLSRPLTMKILRTPAMRFFAVLTLALLPVLLTPLTNLNLGINTYGFSPWIVLLLRSGQVAVFMTAALVSAVCMSEQKQYEIASRSVVLSVVSGVLLAIAMLSAGSSPVLLLAAAIALLASAEVIRTWFEHSREISLSARAATVRTYALPMLGLLCVALTGFGPSDSSRESSLLFSERTMAAVQRGVDQDLILQSHANRLITTTTGQSGQLTVWRRTGNVFEFQRNGTSIGRVSTDTSVSPQPIEDILPAILTLSSHAQPSRVLLLGDDTGACLRTCSHFPVQQIVAVRSDRELTKLAQQFSWSNELLPLEQDERIRILHEPVGLAIRQRELSLFDVVISIGESLTFPSAANEYTAEFYQAVRSRMNSDAVFCQRFRQNQVGPQALMESMASLMTAFSNVGAIQSAPGEILLLASDSQAGLIDPDLMVRLQRDHVRREIASAGWDWAQVAILPLIDAHDPLGIFTHEVVPHSNSVSSNSITMAVPFETVRLANKQAELHAAFGPHQMQVLAAIPGSQDHHEVKRRLSALAQELEILAGMPDQPWTYRKSLQMEMKQSPRPPQDLVEDGKISKVAHPLDLLRRNYFISLGKALTAAGRGELDLSLIRQLNTFTENFEPLITHFAHYEIVRLHELSQHPSPVDEFRHRLHIVFFTSSTDASVRPVISALKQLVDQPTLIANDAERYDMLNSLLQKMIERWEARTAWEPRSALRVQNDVEMSVGVANRALEQMETDSDAANVEKAEFYRRRRYISAALIGPLRDYRDQVLAHRRKSETPVEQGTEDPNDVPLLINSSMGMNTN